MIMKISYSCLSLELMKKKLVQIDLPAACHEIKNSNQFLLIPILDNRRIDTLLYSIVLFCCTLTSIVFIVFLHANDHFFRISNAVH